MGSGIKVLAVFFDENVMSLLDDEEENENDNHGCYNNKNGNDNTCNSPRREIIVVAIVHPIA